MGPEARGLVIFGGTFNPIHLGHLIVAEEVRRRMSADAKILFMPAAQPPHKPPVTVPASHRCAMVQLAIADNPGFERSDLEIARGGTSWTVDTIRDLQAREPGKKIYLLVGADSVPDLPKWRQADTLLRLCQIVVAARPGWDASAIEGLRGRFDGASVDALHRHAFATPRVEISSTEIRRRLAAGESVRYWLPESVENYIKANGLYGVAQTPGPVQGAP